MEKEEETITVPVRWFIRLGELLELKKEGTISDEFIRGYVDSHKIIKINN